MVLKIPLNIFFFSEEIMWIEGKSEGDSRWRTHGFRENDRNNDVTAMTDFSLSGNDHT